MGSQGIVKIPSRNKDYVFFVTFGRKQGVHQFKEEITEEEILTWQSQPSQRLNSPNIVNFITHDHVTNSWQILDWHIDEQTLRRMDLAIAPIENDKVINNNKSNYNLVLVDRHTARMNVM